MLHSVIAAAAVAAVVATPQGGQAVPATQAVIPAVVTPVANPEPSLPEGTPVRLMVTREINSRTAHIGERFKLRVDEPIFINGKPVVPVGSTAWGEIALVKQNGAVGKGGKLSANLLYLDLPTGKIPLKGGYSDKGDGNGAGVVLAVVGFGILGLLNGGDSARLKAGDTFTGYVAGPPLTASASRGESQTIPAAVPAALVQ